jgi:hypothetical protein
MLRDKKKERLLARAGAMEATTTLKRQAQAKLNLARAAGTSNDAYRGRTEIRIRRSETD